MPSLVFVHGTGVREPGYTACLRRIEANLQQREFSVTIIPCFWGGSHGAVLKKGGASIPDYDTTRAIAADAVAAEDAQIMLWGRLYEEPYYELCLLSLMAGPVTSFKPGQLSAGQTFDIHVRELKPSPKLVRTLERAGLAAVFEEARNTVTASAVYRQALEVAHSALDECRAAVARALVAEAMKHCERSDIASPILCSARLRDDTVAVLIEELGGDERGRGIGLWAAKQVAALALRTGMMNAVERRRGMIMDATVPLTGDVLLYQSHGERIRGFIRERLLRLAPPVVLLAHSLGGIASVELLATESVPMVKQLITVGSPVSFLYEIDALNTLPYGEQLPSSFPEWLNLYDRRDLLSFVGEGVFPGRVRDVRIDTGQPFPRSHSSYWEAEDTWTAIGKAIKLLL